MKINDKKGLYEMRLDEKRRILYEKNVGFWKKEDMERQKEDHKKIFERLNKNGIKPWARVSDLTEYKVSSIADEIKENVLWGIKNGQTHVAVIVSSNTIVKMQMNRSGKKELISEYFDNMADAEKWIKEQGF